MAQIISSKKPKQRNKSQQNPTLGPIADLEKHLPSEWWRTLFNSIYLKTDADVVENTHNTIEDVNNLLKFTNIKKEDKILDLCCGQGRHILELAKRGFLNLQGIDRSRYLIRLAKKRSDSEGHYHIKFSEGDARKINLPNCSKDCVTVLGNSFGYFENQKDDLTVLQETNRVLTSNGICYLDITNGEWMKKNFSPKSWEWITQSLLVCRERHLSSDSNRLICREVVIDVEKGVIADQFYAERLYSFEEIKHFLEEADFHEIELMDHLQIENRQQDLGMMGQRIIIKAKAPKKNDYSKIQITKKIKCSVILGDPKLQDQIKRNNQFNLEDFQTIEKMKNALKCLNKFEFEYIDNHANLVQSLIKRSSSLVFNLCDEGFNNDANMELHVPALLELLNIPYTGAGPTCLTICYDKSLVSGFAKSLDIPVPEEIIIDSANSSAAIPGIFPALLKPTKGDSSFGITQNAVVNNSEELVFYFNWLKSKCPKVPILVQEFLSGKEYTVGILGNNPDYEILPILEVDYNHLPKNLPKLLCYESKWDPTSFYWTDIKYKQASLDTEKQNMLIDASIKLFENFNCRDYARFDFREDINGQIKLLEVNPNPGWCWDGKLNIMANLANLSYPKLLEKILLSALERLNATKK